MEPGRRQQQKDVQSTSETHLAGRTADCKVGTGTAAAAKGCCWSGRILLICSLRLWVVSSLVFECTACNTNLPTTGSGCPTKSLEPKFGIRKGQIWRKGVARRECNRRNSSSSGSAHHIPLQVTTLCMRASPRLLGNEARSDHDSAAALQSKAEGTYPRERW